jgi:hypothetical protein
VNSPTGVESIGDMGLRNACLHGCADDAIIRADVGLPESAMNDEVAGPGQKLV